MDPVLGLRLNSSHLNKESIPRTKGTTHASGVASSGAILGDLVNTVPPMLYGLLIIGTGTGTRFFLPRAGTPLSDVDPMDATHVSLLTLLGFFSLFVCYLIPLLCRYLFLLLSLGVLPRSVHRNILWSLLARRAYVLFYWLLIVPILCK